MTCNLVTKLGQEIHLPCAGHFQKCRYFNCYTKFYTIYFLFSKKGENKTESWHIQKKKKKILKIKFAKKHILNKAALKSSQRNKTKTTTTHKKRQG